jgi:hypothetical protein
MTGYLSPERSWIAAGRIARFTRQPLSFRDFRLSLVSVALQSRRFGIGARPLSEADH